VFQRTSAFFSAYADLLGVVNQKQSGGQRRVSKASLAPPPPQVGLKGAI